MESGRPPLGVLVAPDPPDVISHLLAAMRPWCIAAAVERGMDPAAWFATSPSAPGVRDAARSGRPLAVFVHDAAELDRARSLGPAAILATDEALAGREGVLVLAGEADAPADRIAVVPPFVRARFRRRAGLSPRLVVDLRSGDIPGDLAGTALAVCAACIVTGSLADALAWGAPIVTDPETAGATGLADGIEGVVRPAGEMSGAAEELAADDARAASLSRAARRLAESRSVRRLAARLAERLALTHGGGAGWRLRIDATMGLLSSPPSALQPDVERFVAPLERPRPVAPGGYS